MKMKKEQKHTFMRDEVEEMAQWKKQKISICL